MTELLREQMSQLRKTTVFQLPIENSSEKEQQTIQDFIISDGFPAIKRSGHESVISTVQRYTRPRNQFVLMRSLFNRKVNSCILSHDNDNTFAATSFKNSQNNKIFTITSKLTSEIWNESSSDMKRFFSLLATLEEGWHKYKFYCCWNKELTETMNMQPIEDAGSKQRLLQTLSTGVGSSVSTYTSKDLSSRTSHKKKKKKTKGISKLKLNTAQTQTQTLPMGKCYKSKINKNSSSNIYKKRYEASRRRNSNFIIEDLFLSGSTVM